MNLLSFVRTLYRALLVPPSTNYNLKQFALNPYSLLPENGIVLDLGSGGAHGSYSVAYDRTSLRNLRFIGLDVEMIEGVSVVADACAVPIKANSVDWVLCISVLEYIKQPQLVVDEACRVLKPGGYIYLSTPFVFPYHPPPDDLFRFSPEGLRILARQFQEIQAGSNRGPASTFCHLLAHFLAIALCFNSRRVYGLLLDLFKWTFFWIKYLDSFIGKYEVARFLYGNAFFFGKKPMDSPDDLVLPRALIST